MKKKIFITLFLIMLLLANVSFANYQTVTMNVIEEPICTIAFGENSKFEKKLIAKDLANKEVTIQLQVTNEEKAEKPTGEIMLVLDNSNSMTDKITDTQTRKDVIFQSAKTLVTNLLKDNTKLKIGIVRFSTVSINNESTISDASVVSALSNDATALNKAISTIETNGPRTNLEAGLLLASQQFTSTEKNKHMIILTDGIPNVAINSDTVYYSDDVIHKTKQQLQTLQQQGIKTSAMLTGITNEDYVPAGVTKNYGQIIKEIFGTQEKPTTNNFYYVTDAEIEKTITNDIYRSLMPTEKTLKNISIRDYFPEEIVKNFEFSYISKANIGTISSDIDTTHNAITWTIPELATGQTATVQYKLKLKQNFDASIVEKILNTNQKVDITYTDLDDTKQNKTSNISPKIKLTEPTTTSPVALPKAGSFTLIGFVVLLTGFCIFSIVKLILFYKKTK